MSYRSSGEWLPWALVSQDSVEDRDQLAGHGNEREDLRFPGGDEFVAEFFELRVVTCRDHGANKQGTAHAFAAATNEALPTPLPGLVGLWCEANEGGDPSPIERTEF